MVKKRRGQSTETDILRMAEFIILNTSIFHEVLSNQRTEVESLRNLTTPRQPQLLRAWNDIANKIDYKPIFTLGAKVLNSLPTSPETEAVISDLVKMVLSVVASGIQLRHDLMGRIYHKLLLQTMGGYYATYYTSVPAAVLISDLIVKTENSAWNFGDIDRVKGLRIIDPACGSGTLLASTYAAIRDRVVLEYQPSVEELAQFHREMMEHGLYGLDVLDYAAHLTLTTLAMQNPRAKFEDSRIRTLRNGVDNTEKVYLGSLDYLDPQSALAVKKWAASPTNGSEEVSLDPGSFDLVVMNPPFSRSANPNLKFGYALPDIRKKMGKRLKELTEELDLEGIGVAGLGSHFIVLGDKLVRPGGRLGVVIPRHILSGVSWEKIRQIFFRGYEIEYVISNFDPTPVISKNGWCWSENTDLGEVLIIARKSGHNTGTSNCFFVNITRTPRNEVESLLIGQAIRRQRRILKNLMDNSWSELRPLGELSGYAYSVSKDRLKENWHYSCVFSHPEIARKCLELADVKGMTALEAYLISKGRDIHIVKKNFGESAGVTGFPILWGHQKTMKTMTLEERFIGFGVPQHGDISANLHQGFSSSLLVADRPHINTESLLALEVPRPVLATAFWEIHLSDDKLRPLILLWLNSTYGFLLALGAGANSQGPIFKIKQEHLGHIMLPLATPEFLSKCLEYLSLHKREDFHPFPEEFALAANGGGVRFGIDQFFASQLELPQISPEIYRLLSTEPALTTKPRKQVVSPIQVPLPLGEEEPSREKVVATQVARPIRNRRNTKK